MTTEQRSSGTLPGDVLVALRQGNKVEAIKRLREARDLQLKDAKDEVERYIRTDAALARKFAHQTSVARRTLWLILVAAGLAAVAWITSR